MADQKPFKNATGGLGAGAKKSGEERAAPPPGRGIVAAKQTGNPLAKPSDEVVEGQAHGHSPCIPWPPAKNADPDQPTERKPFKV